MEARGQGPVDMLVWAKDCRFRLLGEGRAMAGRGGERGAKGQGLGEDGPGAPGR